MQLIPWTESGMQTIPELKFRHEGNVVYVGWFPYSVFHTLQLTERGVWHMFHYNGRIVRRRWRVGQSVPIEKPEDSGPARCYSWRATK